VIVVYSFNFKKMKLKSISTLNTIFIAINFKQLIEIQFNISKQKLINKNYGIKIKKFVNQLSW
jgi:hypothetical protein